MNIHSSLQAQLTNAVERDKVSHAILFAGDCGYGSLPMALWFAKQLLCNQKTESCTKKVEDLQHADLHFCYPVATTDEVKSKPKTSDFLNYWRDFIRKNPFGTGYEWSQTIGAEKKQIIINTEQAREILNTLSLRSFEGGRRIMVIFLPESMNISSANKLLKIIEEPPEKTIFLLVSEKPEELLPTIISRCQVINVPRLSEFEVENVLKQHFDMQPALANKVAKVSEGNINKALEKILFKSEEFEKLFASWVRNAFRAKTNVAILSDIYDWSTTVASWNKERQKQFLGFCADIFRQALVSNYDAGETAQVQIKPENLKWEGFVPFVHGSNIVEILNEINEAAFHLERNGNAKIIFLDMGIKMTRFIHKKEPKK
ncbi:DNA polymerase III subunit delta' [Flavobacteriaceae bacterium Ap0902]|nr:DNA polymerase III subunit delta' [Flavobacteriaceae bacterium Ap0902]